MKATNSIAVPPKQTFAEFLESTPPGKSRTISDFYVQEHQLLSNFLAWVPATPDIQLHCSSGKCNGVRFFAGKKDILASNEQFFLTYTCKNCNQTERTFVIRAHRYGASAEGVGSKIGEYPPFGPALPARLISLVGGDRETFLTGWRAENMGMGIGAFAYYRRVVESQYARIIDQIQKAAKRLNAEPDVLRVLEQAKIEKQFSRAVDALKDAIPAALLIQSQNPLKLLHSALSSGLHSQNDDECLEIATSIRVVLAELAERIGNAVKDQNELERAVSRLLKSKNPTPEG
jgi:hypothetical protein